MTAPSPRDGLVPPRSTADGRAVWMDQVRGLAIVLVVAYHTKTVLGRFVPDVPDALGLAQELFAPFRMPLLVFLSGMLLSRSLAKPSRTFVSGKLRRIAWPYLVWSVLYLTVAAKASPERFVLLAVEPPNYLWYLYYLLLYYLVVLAAQWLRAPLPLVVPAALLASAAVDLYGPRRFLFLLAFFVAGHLVSSHGDRLRLGSRGLWLTVCTGVSVAGALANASGDELKYEPAFAVVPAAGIALCLLLAPSHTAGPFAWTLGQIGRSSLVFYVAHYPVLWVVSAGLREVGVQAPLPMYAIGFVVALAAGAALVQLRSRWRIVDALFDLPPRVPDGARLAVRALPTRTATSDERRCLGRGHRRAAGHRQRPSGIPRPVRSGRFRARGRRARPAGAGTGRAPRAVGRSRSGCDPRALEQLLAGDDGALGRCQLAEQPALGVGQLDLDAARAKRSRASEQHGSQHEAGRRLGVPSPAIPRTPSRGAQAGRAR